MPSPPPDGSGNVLGAYLRARRELVTPQSAGVSVTGRRRVNGLTRHEIATRAGISSEYYVRLEQGRDRNPSAQVVDAIAAALELDASGHEFLRELARDRPRRAAAASAAPAAEQVPDGVLELIEAWHTTPAFVVGRFGTVLAASAVAQALNPACRPGRNMFREVFLNPESRDRYEDWEVYCAILVAGLRAQVSVDVDDPRMTTLVSDLARDSDIFRQLWQRQDVAPPSSGSIALVHPTAGRLVLGIDTFQLPRSAGITLVVYHASPGTASADALARLTGPAPRDPRPESRPKPRPK